MTHTLIAPPAVEPVTLAEAQAWLNTDDTSLELLISAARQAAEDYTGRAFVTQTWQQTLDYAASRRLPDWLPAGKYQLPYNYFDSPLPQAVMLLRRPVQSATVVTYASDGTPTPFTGFRLAGDQLLLTGDWPAVLRDYDPAVITYVAGYGDPSQVPAPIKTAILMGVQALAASRTASQSLATEFGDMPAGIKTLKAGDSTITRDSSSGAGGNVGASGLPASALAMLAPYRTFRI